VRNFFVVSVFGVILAWIAWYRSESFSVSAQTLPSVRIRALFPQPSTGKPEWVILERVDTGIATFSAILRDTHGSTKAFSWMWEEDRPWYQLTATQSGIALNNDQDGVTVEVNGIVIDSSPTYTSSERDFVWTRVSTGWQWLALTEFEERRENGNWNIAPTPTPTPVPSPTPAPSVAPSPALQFLRSNEATRAAATMEKSANAPSSPYPGKAIVLDSNSVSSRLETTDTATPIPFIEPDYAGEQARYQAWLLWWRRSLGLFLGSAVCWWSVVVSQMVKRMKKRTARRWGWSLLS
jgi:hypothetical protein